LQRRIAFFISSVAKAALNGYLKRGIDEGKLAKGRVPSRERGDV
jgi:hypothetical protein